jgi:hypothetical protein
METVTKKKKKAGRPAQDVKKEIRACVRYDKQEYFIIKHKASKAGLNVSAYIRQITVNGYVKIRLTDEERQFVRQLIGMANNINQIAKTCHDEGLLRAMEYFETYRNQIDEILEKLKS